MFGKDINETFENKFYQMELYKNNFFEKIKRKILNIISGKKKMAEVIKRYKEENLKQIIKSNDVKIINTITITNGILKQIKIVDNQINLQYQEAMQNAS